MLDIRLYGEFRKLTEHAKATDISKLDIPYIEGETVDELLSRVGIDPDRTGELLVNFSVAEFHTVIPRDSSRVAIFPIGMVLLCGASHLKGHSYSELRDANVSYYGKPEVS